MRIEAFLFSLAVLAPLLCHFLLRSTFLRLASSVVISAVLVAFCIFIGEARRTQPDYDIFFGVVLVAWAGIAVVYAIVASMALSALAGVVRRARESRENRK